MILRSAIGEWGYLVLSAPQAIQNKIVGHYVESAFITHHTWHESNYIKPSAMHNNAEPRISVLFLNKPATG